MLMSGRGVWLSSRVNCGVAPAEMGFVVKLAFFALIEVVLRL
jgi:hypothetical protein